MTERLEMTDEQYLRWYKDRQYLSEPCDRKMAIMSVTDIPGCDPVKDAEDWLLRLLNGKHGHDRPIVLETTDLHINRELGTVFVGVVAVGKSQKWVAHVELPIRDGV